MKTKEYLESIKSQIKHSEDELLEAKRAFQSRKAEVEKGICNFITSRTREFILAEGFSFTDVTPHLSCELESC